MSDIRVCPECGGHGYYLRDHFGEEVKIKVACLFCTGQGVIEEEEI